MSEGIFGLDFGGGILFCAFLEDEAGLVDVGGSIA